MNTIMPWNGYEMLALLLCGCFTACIGALLIKAATLVGALLNRLHGKFVRLILGGLALSCILIVFPMLRGQGYESIEQLLIGDDSVVTQASWILRRLPPAWLPCLILFAVFILKPIASALTIGIGDGGIFAPTIFIGAFAGYTFAKCVNMLGLGTLNTCNFAAFGICGVFATVMRSPLTAIFLVIETTGQLVLMAPLMVVSAVSVIIGHFMVPSSIYRGTKVGDKHGEQKA